MKILKKILKKWREYWMYKCPKCKIEMDAYSYDISGSLFYYVCENCKHEEHPGY